MAMPMKNPPHPGTLVKHELAELGIPVAEAAKALGVTRQALYNVINGKTGISPEMAVRLAKGIGSTADGWLRMQLTFDLARLSETKIKVEKLTRRQFSAA
jgi:addiction module HigA family antidote